MIKSTFHSFACGVTFHGGVLAEQVECQTADDRELDSSSGLRNTAPRLCRIPRAAAELRTYRPLSSSVQNLMRRP